MNEKSNWKLITYLIGGSIGVLTGLFAAFLIIRKRENQQDSVKLTSTEGMKIGMSLVSLLKLISEIGTR